MSIERRLQREIKDSKIRYSRENDDSPYKRYLMKRIDLINRVLENMKILLPNFMNFLLAIVRMLNLSL
ncbi:MAG: hypothetical protein WAL23_06115 [Nitrososphaeraceae archaeon]